MTFRIDRTRRVVSARRASAAASDAGQETERTTGSQLPVPVGPVVDVPRTEHFDGEAAFAAQLMGQDGQKRGLRAGQPALDAARKLYSSIEWSGARDRRARKGRRAKTAV